MKYKTYLDNRYIRLLAMSLIIILALIFVQDYAEFLDEHSDKVVKLGGNLQCNAVTSICSASIKNERGFKRLSFTVKTSPAAQSSFSIALNAIGFDLEGIDSVSVAFNMPGEDMDDTLVLLSPDKSTRQVVPENWHATATLPDIANGRKDWHAVVSLKSSEREYRAEFLCRFDVKS